MEYIQNILRSPETYFLLWLVVTIVYARKNEFFVRDLFEALIENFFSFSKRWEIWHKHVWWNIFTVLTFLATCFLWVQKAHGA